MSIENLISEDELDILWAWKSLPDLIDSGKINFDELQKFFDLNKEKIENSFNKLDISKINFILSLISFHTRSYNPINAKKNHIYLSKFFLFEFLCNYLSDYSETKHFLKENFIPIIQQVLLSKSNNYNEENYQNVIIHILAKYFLRNNKIPFRIILRMIHKFSNEKNFLGLFDATDLEKSIIPPEIIQEKIANYLIIPSENISYISDILILIPYLEKNLSKIENKKANQYLTYKEEYNRRVDDYLKELDDHYFFWIEDDYTKPQIRVTNSKDEKNKSPFLCNSPLYFYTNPEFFDAYISIWKKRESDSAQLMHKLVNIAKKLALNFQEFKPRENNIFPSNFNKLLKFIKKPKENYNAILQIFSPYLFDFFGKNGINFMQNPKKIPDVYTNKSLLNNGQNTREIRNYDK